MSDAFARFLWGWAMRLATPLLLARWWWRGRAEPGYREKMSERLGFYEAAPDGTGRLWLHAVSLGETLAAKQAEMDRFEEMDKNPVINSAITFMETLPVALVMALGAASLGLVLGLGGCSLADVVARTYLPRIPFQPDSWFVVPWWLPLGAVAAAVACALLGAWSPARAVARLDPARALEG